MFLVVCKLQYLHMTRNTMQVNLKPLEAYDIYNRHERHLKTGLLNRETLMHHEIS